VIILKRKSLMVLLVLTLMSSVLFAQSALGANLYLAGGQKASNAQYSVTYKGLVSVIGGKLKPVNIGTQRVYYVYTNADQGVGYYKVFVNRYFGWNPPSDDQPQEPHLPQPPEQPEEPHQPPIQPEPKPEGPKQPAPKPEELKQPEPNPEQPQQPGAYQLTADEQKLINLINSERIKAGAQTPGNRLQPLQGGKDKIGGYVGKQLFLPFIPHLRLALPDDEGLRDNLQECGGKHSKNVQRGQRPYRFYELGGAQEKHTHPRLHACRGWNIGKLLHRDVHKQIDWVKGTGTACLHR
jgi:hypothetical protein